MKNIFLQVKHLKTRSAQIPHALSFTVVLQFNWLELRTKAKPHSSYHFPWPHLTVGSKGTTISWEQCMQSFSMFPVLRSSRLICALVSCTFYINLKDKYKNIYKSQILLGETTDNEMQVATKYTTIIHSFYKAHLQGRSKC